MRTRQLINNLCIVGIALCLFLENTTVYVSFTNLFKQCFKEPFENLCLVCYDGSFFQITTHEKHRISITSVWLKEFLQKRGFMLKDVATIIHNHPIKPFSYSDIVLYKELKRQGFQGKFCLWLNGSQKVVFLEE